MGKSRTSVTLDDDVASQVREDDTAFSALVNQWAREYYQEGRTPAMHRQHIQSLQSNLEKREEEFEEMVAEVSQLFADQRRMLDEALGDAPTSHEDYDQELEEVYNQLTKRVDRGRYVEDLSTPRDPDNPAIQAKASNLGISPEHLVDELRQRDRRDGFDTPTGKNEDEISE